MEAANLLLNALAGTDAVVLMKTWTLSGTMAPKQQV